MTGIGGVVVKSSSRLPHRTPSASPDVEQDESGRMKRFGSTHSINVGKWPD